MPLNRLTKLEYLCAKLYANPGQTTTYLANCTNNYDAPAYWREMSTHDDRIFMNTQIESILKSAIHLFEERSPKDLGPKEKTRWFLTHSGRIVAELALRRIGIPSPERINRAKVPHLSFTRQLLTKMIDEGGMTRADAKAYYDSISNASPDHSSLRLTVIIRTYCTTHEPRPSKVTGRDSLWCKVDAKIMYSMLSGRTALSNAIA
jgi:hypothetical protein